MKEINGTIYNAMFVDEAVAILESLPINAKVRYIWHDTKNFNFDKIHGWYEHEIMHDILYRPKYSRYYDRINHHRISFSICNGVAKRLKNSPFPEPEHLSEIIINCFDCESATIDDRRINVSSQMTVAELLIILDNFSSDTIIRLYHESKNGTLDISDLHKIIYSNNVVYLKPLDSFHADFPINGREWPSDKIHEWEKENPDHIQIIKTL